MNGMNKTISAICALNKEGYNPQQIERILTLVAEAQEPEQTTKRAYLIRKREKTTTGKTGVILRMIQEANHSQDSAQDLNEIMARLKNLGFPTPQNTVATLCYNLTKKYRNMKRFKKQNSNNRKTWFYYWAGK